MKCSFVRTVYSSVSDRGRSRVESLSDSLLRLSHFPPQPFVLSAARVLLSWLSQRLKLTTVQHARRCFYVSMSLYFYVSMFLGPYVHTYYVCTFVCDNAGTCGRVSSRGDASKVSRCKFRPFQFILSFTTKGYLFYLRYILSPIDDSLHCYMVWNLIIVLNC